MIPVEELSFDLVVVGGGLSGLCCALAAARHGVSTALIQNRPVLGGNASSEVRMHICGADQHARKNARETGIIEELQLKNRAINPNYSFSTLDTVLWQEATFQENLSLYLNTHMNEAVMEKGSVAAVYCDQLTSERRFIFRAPLFVDATGDATLAHLAGAAYKVGREGTEEYGEKWAPAKEDHYTMGNSLMFTAVDMGHPVPFKKPDWAYTFTEEDMVGRNHKEISSGYWWIELGGDDLDVIHDAEEIRDELLRTLYGVWDHIKNGGDHGAENYALDWVGHLPGKRESRRVIGDYTLTEGDILQSRVFPDAVAYGGWSMDCHVVGGMRAKEKPNDFWGDFDVYTIPYRCLYAKDVPNLFIGGRAFSTSHMAFSSVRVMATCAVVGQAIGTAAAIAHQKGILPRDVNGHIGELQQTLMLDDCYIPGYKNLHPGDIAPQGSIQCSSQTAGGEGALVLDGYMRNLDHETHAWVSEPSDQNPWIQLAFDGPRQAKELILRWDSDTANELMISISQSVRNTQKLGMPKTLVKNYDIALLQNGKEIYTQSVRDNILRMNRLPLPDAAFDAVRVTVGETWGDPSARLFQVQVMG